MIDWSAKQPLSILLSFDAFIIVRDTCNFRSVIMKNKHNIDFSTLIWVSIVLTLNVKANKLENEFVQDSDPKDAPTCIRDHTVWNFRWVHKFEIQFLRFFLTIFGRASSL